MKKLIFTPRHTKLIELKDNLDLLILGQSNREYINMLKKGRVRIVQEIRKEQATSYMKES